MLSTPAASPMTSAQPSSAASGRVKCGSPATDSEKSPRPDHSPRPRKISAPMPDASRPGSRISSSVAPPNPTTSIIRKAPVIGEPSSELIAAKLPAAPITVFTCGADLAALARLTAQAASPPPSAMSGASGPSTAPKPSVASAASATPASSLGGKTPLALKPSAGECPPVPGKYVIERATRMPPTASSGNGHHTGTDLKPRSSGKLTYSQCSSLLTSARKPQATAEIGAPRTAATTSSRT